MYGSRWEQDDVLYEVLDRRRVFKVTVNGLFDVSTLDHLDQFFDAQTEDEHFAVVFVEGPEFGGLSPTARAAASSRMRGKAGAIVTERPGLRMVITAVGLAVRIKGQHLKAFDDVERARDWCHKVLAGEDAAEA